MTTEVLAMPLVAGVQSTAGQGRIWYLKTATSPVSITAESAGSATQNRKFTNISAGFKFTAPVGNGWTYLRILSALTQNIEIVVGDDDVEIAGAVSIIGTVATTAPVSGAFTPSVADISIGTGYGYSIAQNVSRSSITIGALSTNTGSVRVQSPGAGANRGLELAPGIFAQFNQTAAIDVRNDSGATQFIYVFEQL